MKIKQNPETVHRPLAGYSHGIRTSGAQDWLILSGQVGMRPDGNISPDPIEQFQVALTNIERNLKAAGMEVGDIVKLTMYLVDEVDAEKRRSVLAEWLAGHEPCMTLLYVAGLASPALRIEIEAIASIERGAA